MASPNIDVRRQPLFDARQAVTSAQGSAADRAEAALQQGRGAALEAFLSQTASLRGTPGGASKSLSLVPAAVPARTFKGDGKDSGDQAHGLSELAVVMKERERGNIRSACENGRMLINSPCFAAYVHRTVLAHGRWMYEVHLHSDGLFQIGWCPPHDSVQWTPQLGIGDFPHSLAYDGSRRKLWKGCSRPNGSDADEATRETRQAHLNAGGTDEWISIPHWCDGDIITACVDLDAGVATYFHNGEFAARTPVPCLANAPEDEDDESLVQYLTSAAVSVGRSETMLLNLGDAPFAYPQPGYAGVSWASSRIIGTDAAAVDTGNAQLFPAFLHASVGAETIAAILHPSSHAMMSPKERNLAVARVLAKLDDEATSMLGSAVAHLMLRAASQDLDLADEAEALLLDSKADAAAFAASDSLIPSLDALACDAEQVLRHIMVELAVANRPLTFDVPSKRAVNTRSKAALRLAAHVVSSFHQQTKLLAKWPAAEGINLDGDITPFAKPRYATQQILQELVPEVDLLDPLGAADVRQRAQDLGNDFFLHISPFRERILEPIVKSKPTPLINYIASIAERQDSAATGGTMFFALIAACIVRHAHSLTDEQFLETYASRRILAAERGARVEQRRLGGSVTQVLRRTGTVLPRATGEDPPNTLLISATWLFHATARRHIPSVMRTVGELRKCVEELKKGESADPTKLIERINELTQKAVLARGRIAHEHFVKTLVDYASLLGRVLFTYGHNALAAVQEKTHDKNTTTSPVKSFDEFRASCLQVTERATQDSVDFMLIPTGFAIALSLILQMLRRSMPTATSAHLSRLPQIGRGALMAVMHPLVDPSESAESAIHLAQLITDPAGPNPVPHGRALADFLQPSDVATLLMRSFKQMANDMAWSVNVNLLSSVAAGSTLVWQRQDEDTSGGWLMWGGEHEPADTPVPAHPDMPTRELMEAAIGRLESAQAAKDFNATHQSVTDDEKQQREGREFCAGFSTVVGRCSWLHSEFGVGAQDELAGRGTQQSRHRMSIIFDLLQRALLALEFFLDVAGDSLLTDAEAADAANPAAQTPIVIQQTVELTMLILRDYGIPESLAYMINKAPTPETKAMHPWRLIGPATGILLAVLRPKDRKVSADAAPPEERFANWQLCFQRALTSPRMGWDLRHVQHAIGQLHLTELIAERRATSPMKKLEWLMSSEEWEPVLRTLYELNQTGSMSPNASRKKKQSALGNDGPDLAAIGATFSTASLEDMDDSLCPICYVDCVNVEFDPCGHRSCRVCIERQLAGQQKRCFFCNAEVDAINDIPDAPQPTTPLSSRPQSAAVPPTASGFVSSPTSRHIAADGDGGFPVVDDALPVPTRTNPEGDSPSSPGPAPAA